MDYRKKLYNGLEILPSAILLLIMGIVFIFFTVVPIIILVVNSKNMDFASIGQIGDTIGGITAPIINLIGAILVFLALKAQTQANSLIQEQIDDQTEQHQINRITDIIHQQIQRIDESIKSQTFLFYKPGTKVQEKVQGYSGLYTLNETIKLKIEVHEFSPEAIPNELEELLVANLNQLIEIYDKISTAGTIVESLLEKSRLNPEQSSELVNLLILNLGKIIKENTTKIQQYLEIRDGKYAYFDHNYNDIQVQKLDVLVAGSFTLFNNALTSAEAKRYSAE